MFNPFLMPENYPCRPFRVQIARKTLENALAGAESALRGTRLRRIRSGKTAMTEHGPPKEGITPRASRLDR